MTLNLNSSGGLFKIMQHVVELCDDLHTHHGTTVPALVETVLGEMSDIAEVEGQRLVTSLVSSTGSYRDQSSFLSSLDNYFRTLLISRVVADQPQVPEKLTSCLDEVERQVEEQGLTVLRNTVSATVTPPDADAPTLRISVYAADGTVQEAATDETLIGEYAARTRVKISSGSPQRNRLAWDWPEGSGISVQLTVQETGLLANQSFDTEDTNETHVPESWLLMVGTPGATVSLTDTEVQTIEITGSPTSGTFSLSFENLNGDVQTTDPLPYNATAAEVQAELAAFVGLSDVTVTLDGATYTVSFNGVIPAGDQGLLTETNTFDTGGITILEDTAGDTGFEYRALAIIGDSSTELTRFRQRLHTLGLQPTTVYGWNCQMAIDTGTTGTIIVELVDGEGTVMTDDAGNSNQETIDLSTLDDDEFTAVGGFFRTPATLPDVFYLQIRLGSGLDVGEAVYLDDFILTPATELYDGGPYVALYVNKRWTQAGDRYEIAVSNDWQGRIQTWWYRWYQRLLPSVVSGPSILDPGASPSSSSSSSSSNSA